MWKGILSFFAITVLTSVYGDVTKNDDVVNQNPESDYELIEGDIMVPKESHLRGAIKLDLGQWPYRKSDGKYVIAYQFNETIRFDDEKMLNSISFVMAFIEKHTNIKFEVKSRDHHAYFTINNNLKGGCSSTIGWSPKWPNDCNMNLNLVNCTITPDIIYEGVNYHCIQCNTILSVFHEMGHQLGLHHEHQRADRDAYITTDGSKGGILDANLYDWGQITPYDFASIMHYKATSHLTTRPEYNEEIEDLTFIINNNEIPSTCDMREINIMYPGKVKPGPCIPHQRETLCRPTNECYKRLGKEKCETYCKFDKNCPHRFESGRRYNNKKLICDYLRDVDKLEKMDPWPQYAYTGPRARPL